MTNRFNWQIFLFYSIGQSRDNWTVARNGVSSFINPFVETINKYISMNVK